MRRDSSVLIYTHEKLRLCNCKAKKKTGGERGEMEGEEERCYECSWSRFHCRSEKAQN